MSVYNASGSGDVHIDRAISGKTTKIVKRNAKSPKRTPKVTKKVVKGRK